MPMIFKNRLMRMSPLERSKGRFMRGPESHEDAVEIDMDAAIADISDSLFGQDESGNDPSNSTAEQPEKVSETPTPETPPAAQPNTEDSTPSTEIENSQSVQETGAPKTWTKEAIAEWAAIPPRAQQEILKREQDMFQGLEQYREKAELGAQYDKVVEPFRAVLAAENVNPIQLFEAFAGNHYLLSRGTPEQKLSLAANMLQHYGIDLTALVQRMGDQPQKDPYTQELEQRLARLESGLNERQASEMAAKKQAFEEQVNQFAQNPDNHYFQEVASDMANLLKTGAATSLSQAYEMAVYANPVTRAKELDRLAAERAAALKNEEAERVRAAEAAKAANVKTTTKTRDGTMPVGSLDETLAETMAAIRARG